MEVDEDIQNEKVSPKKHSAAQPVEEIHKNENAKKVRLFSPKEFRKSLRHDNRTTVLKQFLNAIHDSNGHDYVFEYLENGGNCLELLQTLELDSTLSPVLVFELVALVLLKITASGPQYQSAAFESCRYILNNYIMVINKMLNLSSSTQERKICLKLLTAMVTFSSTLAKDVLLHVNFHSTNVELLTKNTGEKNSVRDHFIHFLTAFLIDGHYQSLSILLEKKGFITSIIKGLQFDAADTVCVVISAMKNHILENVAVSKTAKMRIFNTLVVRDVVNLYNWKGPAALKAQGKNKPVSVQVDEYSKSKVNECVHDFLIVLCTSHKFGVIFKDHSLGLGKTHQNALMYTVLESLERYENKLCKVITPYKDLTLIDNPWDHSYARELVTKICVACPDLTKTMWTNLKTSLEPRLTEKWLNALKFAKNLLSELQPDCIEFCATEMNPTQLTQAIQILAAPLPVLKAVVAEDRLFVNHTVKRHVMSLQLEMLRCLNSYLDASKRWLTVENQEKLKMFTSNYVLKNFLDANTVLNDFEAQNLEENDSITDERYLEMVFDIFELYNKIAPQLLDSLNSTSFQLRDFLEKLSSSCGDETVSARLQVKMINIFLDLEPANFLPHTELFSFVLPVLLKFYHRTINGDVLNVLNKLLKYTGIFEGCLQEINVWINGLLNLKRFEESVVQDFISVLKISVGNIMEFSEELSVIKTEEEVEGNFGKLLEKLKNVDLNNEYESVVVKHRYLSPMVLGLVKYLETATLTKSLKSYVNFAVINLFHSQTDMVMLTEFVKKYQVPKNIKDYVLSWTEDAEVVFISQTGRIVVFEQFNAAFFADNFEKRLDIDFHGYHDLPLNLLETCIFYIVNLLKLDNTPENVFQNSLIFINRLVDAKLFRENYTETVLAHPVLLHNFSLLRLGTNECTRFLLDIIKLLQSSGLDISRYLGVYREKSVTAILKVLKKPKKYDILGFINAIQLFGLDYQQCVKVLTVFTEKSGNEFYPGVTLDILWYALKQLSSLYSVEDNREPLHDGVIKQLTTYFVALSSEGVDVAQLSEAFNAYFEVFPHHIKHITPELLQSIANVTEYNKENVVFITFFLQRNIRLFDGIKDNVEDFCNKKGVLLPVLEVLVQKNVDENILEEIFNKFEVSLTKALLKPQKVGQHFHTAYKGLTVLIKKFMAMEKCNNFADKVQKFEVSDVFHVKLLESVFMKVIEDDITSKQANNIILTFVHLQMHIFKKKSNEDSTEAKITEIAECFNNILTKIRSKSGNMDLKSASQNETLKSYIVYCLKLGVSGHTVLLKTLTNLVKVLSASMDRDAAKLILDMLLSHSKFLDIVLGEHSPVKLEIFVLFLTLCRTWTEFMERYHVPMLLASYRAMTNSCDWVIGTLLKMYAAIPNQTHFLDFKPFLWGRAAASHYSVRQETERNLWRQPKMRDVLDILEENYVLLTIANYPLREKLHLSDEEIVEIEDRKIYDIKFLLPIFSQLLAPEQPVQTYAFTRSGALSLTVVSLSSEDQRTREAALHVLSRFHYHVDANQKGKDNNVWIRYIEAVCIGIAALPDKKLNNFSAIYLARMALILTQPNHVMFVPLSQHLMAKSTLDFSTVPELYTFLHSSDVNYKEHRHFILELLRDGLRTDKDFTDFLRSMAFKLFSDLYNSSLADVDTRLLILEVILAACKIPLGVKMLCENHSLLTQISQAVGNVLILPSKEKQEARLCVSKMLRILLQIGRTLRDIHSLFIVFNAVLNVVRDDIFGILTEDDRKSIYEVLFLVSGQLTRLFSHEVVNLLLEKSGDKSCKYIVEYGCDFVDVSCLCTADVCYYLKLLIFNIMKT